jgi:exodeoxyribonuclease VII large subunit
MRDVQQQLDLSREALQRHVTHKTAEFRARLAHAGGTLQARSPAREVVMQRHRLLDLQRRFKAMPLQVVGRAKERFLRAKGILRVLGPEATLSRGYSITTDEGGKVIRTIKAVQPRMRIHTRLNDGQFSSIVS